MANKNVIKFEKQPTDRQAQGGAGASEDEATHIPLESKELQFPRPTAYAACYGVPVGLLPEQSLPVMQLDECPWIRRRADEFC